MGDFHLPYGFPKRNGIRAWKAFTMLVSLNALDKSVGVTNCELAISFFLPHELVMVGVGAKRDL